MAVRHSTDGCPRHRMAASNSPSCRFAPSKSSCRRTIEERVFVYGVFGGTPRYLSPLDPSQSLGEHHAAAVRPGWPTPRRARNRPPDGAQRGEHVFFGSGIDGQREPQSKRDRSGAGIESTNTSYYFDRLETLQIIEKHHPALADPARSKADSIQDSRSRIPVLFPVSLRPRGQYELYGENAYADLIEPELPDFVSETFESLCHQAVPALYADYQLTQVPSQWWYKSQEVDVVAPTNESMLIAGGEIHQHPLGYDVLADLEDDVEQIDWTPTGGGEPTYEFALFSRSGFKRSVELRTA